MCPTACMNNLDTLRTLPNVRRFACCDCGEGSQGMLCRTERRKIETACGSSGFDCRDNAEEVGCICMLLCRKARVCHKDEIITATLVSRPVL